MTKMISLILCAAACVGGGSAVAQDGTTLTGRSAIDRQGNPLHSRYVTATGQTVPRPSELPQVVAPTRPDRWSYEKDRRIENSICSNC